MTAKHTPGPWKNGNDAAGKPLMFQRPDCWYVDPNPDWQANLKLVDAAPDLLALARQYAEECGDCAGTRVCPDDEPCTASEDYTQPCPDCADLRAILERKP
jgi:hypothetical protein